MNERFHIIITGESGHSSSFQFSKKNFFLAIIASFSSFLVITALVFFTSGSYFSNQQLCEQLDTLQAQVDGHERARASYLTEVERLEKLNQQHLAALQQDYNYKLNTLKAQFDVDNTTLQMENVELMNTAIKDLNARSELIESVMDNIGVKIIKSGQDTSANSGGPFIPVQTAPYDELMKKVDNYLRTIKGMPLGKPVDGLITSRFGNRTDPLNKQKGFHEGVDIRGKHGSDIRATAAGKVIKAFVNAGYGNYVEIDHGNGYRTVYAHMKNYLVKKGEHVKQGQVIGQVGSTGRSTGPHLHYEIRLNKKPVSPVKFMKISNLRRSLKAVPKKLYVQNEKRPQ